MFKRSLLLLVFVASALGHGSPVRSQTVDLNDPVFTERKEVVLSEDQVQRFIQLRKAEKATNDKFPYGDQGEAINMARITRKVAEMQSLLPKFGFDPKGDYRDIQWTINGLISSFNYDTNEFVDPSDAWRKRIADAESSAASMEKIDGVTAEDIASMKQSTAESIESMKQYIDEPAPRNPANVTLVKRYLKDLRHQ